jgi:thiol:disulfide interchange protein DsbD
MVGKQGVVMKRNGRCVALAMLLLTALATVAHGQGDPAAFGSAKVVSVEALWNQPRARPGDQRVLAVVLRIQEHYHINPDRAQLDPSLPFLIPTQVVAQEIAGATIGAVQFPPAQSVTVGYAGEPKPIKAYESQVVLFLPVVIAADAALGPREMKLAVTFQSCDENSCLPPSTKQLTVPLEVVALGESTGEAADAALFAGFDSGTFARMGSAGAPQWITLDAFGWKWQIDASNSAGLLLLLLAAGVGGFLLNLTPCVLPVVPLKIMGLSQAAGNRGRCLLLGSAMSAGVVLFWLGLGIAIAALTGFTAINQLFQLPPFTIGVGVVIAIMAVGMCGLFSLQLPQWVYRINPGHDTVAGSVGFGLMTAVLSTPCTAPFMGSAAAWAARQSPTITLLTFLAIGAGMALPYLVLSAAPDLVRRMPRTGPASELIKQVMGLLMLAAAAFFIGNGLSGLLVTPPDSPSRLYWWFVALFIAASGLWLAWRTLKLTRATGKRVVFGGAGLVVAVAAFIMANHFTDPGPIDWVNYTPQRFEEARKEGKVIVLEFTAEWCLNCKALEQVVLHDPRVVQAMAQPGVVPMKVDLTGNNDAGNRKLAAVNRVAIPVLVVFDRAGREAFNSDAYTVGQVVEAIGAAGK